MKKHYFAICALFAAACIGFSACGGAQHGSDGNSGAAGSDSEPWAPDAPGGTEAGGMTGPSFHYGSIVEQGFHDTKEQAESYFSLDRNTASYSQVRAQLRNGYTVAPDSVRTEELINYFSYGYPAPAEEVGVTAYLSDCPWNEAHKLVTVGIRTAERKIEAERNNYVFLVDLSGSMAARVAGLEGTTCLDLVKTGILKLVEGLTERDAVSIVSYASRVETVLEPTLADEAGKTEIGHRVLALNANGYTNGSGGLELAYQHAERYRSEDGNNRVILMTDGDFNVGIRSTEALKTFISEKAASGVYLSVLGFGIGNMRDDIMQELALSGNGNYAYIDTPREAEKVLCEELSGTLVTVAKDAKAGVKFDPEKVSKYRLLGYDMKLLSEDDFNDPEKDAGEIGSNLCVTAVYETELCEDIAGGDTLATVEIRYRSAGDGEAAKSVTAEVLNTAAESEDVSFIACVAEFGLILRRSEFRGTASLAGVLSRLEGMKDYLAKDLYKEELKELVAIAKDAGIYGG